MRFLKVEKAPSEKLLALLDTNEIGTPGKSMVYRHGSMRKKIFEIPHPHFVNLKKGAEVMGTCCFCERTTDVDKGAQIPSFYIRYFSFKKQFRRLAASVRDTSVSLIRGEVKEVLDGPPLGKNKGSKFFHYAYVDPDNERSRRLCKEFGFISVRKFSPILFGRLFPKKQAGITELSAGERGSMRELLKVFYQGHSMFSEENLFGNRPYFVLREGGKIVAGAQASPDNWKILSLPGRYGLTAVSVITVIPILNRLLSRDFRFLAIEGTYHAPGHQSSLSKLIEGLLNHHRLNTALMFLDVGGAMFKTISGFDLGTANRLSKPVVGDVICKFSGMSGSEIEYFKNTPAYISAVDVT